MIIKALTIENFKGIREPVRVEFKPITLLFGPNSAGNGRPADRGRPGRT